MYYILDNKILVRKYESTQSVLDFMKSACLSSPLIIEGDEYELITKLKIKIKS